MFVLSRRVVNHGVLSLIWCSNLGRNATIFSPSVFLLGLQIKNAVMSVSPL